MNAAVLTETASDRALRDLRERLLHPERFRPVATPPATSVVVWKGVVPLAGGGEGPGEWLHCPACARSFSFPHGQHGRALLLEALDEHLGHTGGGGRRDG